MPEGSNARYGGKRLFEQLQPLGGELRAKERHSGNVPAWLSEAGHEPISDRVTHDRHHDGDSGRRLLCSAAAGVLLATMTSTLRRTSSFANSANRSIFPSAYRY